MIYSVFGNDRELVYKKSKELLRDLKKGNNKDYYSMDEGSFDPNLLGSLSSGPDIFGRQAVVGLRGLFGTSSLEDEIVAMIDSMSESQNVFVFIDDALAAETKKLLKKFAKEVFEFKKASSKDGAFNVFELTNAWARGDRKNAWILFQRAMREGLSPEELVGILFWQSKSLILAKTTALPESGLKPFVYNKAKRYVAQESLESLKERQNRLVMMPHKARMGGMPLDIALEIFLLT